MVTFQGFSALRTKAKSTFGISPYIQHIIIPLCKVFHNISLHARSEFVALSFIVFKISIYIYNINAPNPTRAANAPPTRTCQTTWRLCLGPLILPEELDVAVAPTKIFVTVKTAVVAEGVKLAVVDET